MIVVWASGLFIASSGGWLTSGWMQAKLAVVIILSGLHGAMVAPGRAGGKIAAGFGDPAHPRHRIGAGRDRSRRLPALLKERPCRSATPFSMPPRP